MPTCIFPSNVMSHSTCLWLWISRKEKWRQAMQSLSTRINNVSQYQTQNLSGSTFNQCSETNIHLTLSVAILVFGLLANTQLLIFAINQLKLRKTPDKVLILNLATVNLVALAVCLPMHINDMAEGSVDRRITTFRSATGDSLYFWYFSFLTCQL